MSVILPNDAQWAVNGWISRAFFIDAKSAARKGSALKNDIGFCLKAGMDTLDLREPAAGYLQQFRDVVDSVIRHNEDRQGSNFQEPGFFPVYAGALQELRKLTAELFDSANLREMRDGTKY